MLGLRWWESNRTFIKKAKFLSKTKNQSMLSKMKSSGGKTIATRKLWMKLRLKKQKA